MEKSEGTEGGISKNRGEQTEVGVSVERGEGTEVVRTVPPFLACQALCLD